MGSTNAAAAAQRAAATCLQHNGEQQHDSDIQELDVQRGEQPGCEQYDGDQQHDVQEVTSA